MGIKHLLTQGWMRMMCNIIHHRGTFCWVCWTVWKSSIMLKDKDSQRTVSIAQMTKLTGILNNNYFMWLSFMGQKLFFNILQNSGLYGSWTAVSDFYNTWCFLGLVYKVQKGSNICKNCTNPDSKLMPRFISDVLQALSLLLTRTNVFGKLALSHLV